MLLRNPIDLDVLVLEGTVLVYRSRYGAVEGGLNIAWVIGKIVTCNTAKNRKFKPKSEFLVPCVKLSLKAVFLNIFFLIWNKNRLQKDVQFMFQNTLQIESVVSEIVTCVLFYATLLNIHVADVDFSKLKLIWDWERILILSILR